MLIEVFNNISMVLIGCNLLCVLYFRYLDRKMKSKIGIGIMLPRISLIVDSIVIIELLYLIDSLIYSSPQYTLLFAKCFKSFCFLVILSWMTIDAKKELKKISRLIGNNKC